MPMASKFFPLRVLLSCSTGAESRLISFSDGSGEPSTQPFHPFLAATLFFGGCLGFGEASGNKNSSSSSGVKGRLEDVREVEEEMEGPGVEMGDDGKGGGVTDTDRCPEAR